MSTYGATGESGQHLGDGKGQIAAFLAEERKKWVEGAGQRTCQLSMAMPSLWRKARYSSLMENKTNSRRRSL